MARLFFILCFLLSFNSFAQSYLGKSKKDILRTSQINFENATITFDTSSKDPFIEILNDYETLHYYLENEVCVKFVVYKPYSCNCLEKDIKAYDQYLIPHGDLQWISLDQSKIYRISLLEDQYSTTITSNEERPLSSFNEQ